MIICQAFGLLPSAYARQLFGHELPSYVSSLDWYCFDVAAADRYAWLTKQAIDEGRSAPSTRGKPRRPRTLSNRPVIASSGDDLLGLGFYEEKPPW